MSKEKKKRGRRKKLDRLDRMCLYCADYNKKHGTNCHKNIIMVKHRLYPYCPYCGAKMDRG